MEKNVAYMIRPFPLSKAIFNVHCNCSCKMTRLGHWDPSEHRVWRCIVNDRYSTSQISLRTSFPWLLPVAYRTISHLCNPFRLGLKAQSLLDVDEPVFQSVQ